MPTRPARVTAAGWAAFLGSATVALVAPVFSGRSSIAGIPLDAVILSVLVSILLGVPLLRRLGVTAMPRVGVEVPALAFLGWALASVLATGFQTSTLATWIRYAGYVLLVFVTAAVAVDPMRRRLLMWAITIAGSVTVAQGFMQYVRPAEEGIGMGGLDASVATRIFASFENPNFYAEYLVLLFAVTLGLFFIERGLLRYVVAFLLAAQAIALLLTYTRGSWIALAVGIVVGLLMIDGRLVWPFVFGGTVFVPLVPGALARFQSLFTLEGTASFRLKLWEVAGVAMAERPLFGVGPGRFYEAFTDAVLNNAHLNVGYLVYGAHNSYFQLGAEIGVIGMIAFVWMVFEACRMGAYYNVRMPELRSRLTNAALTAGLIAFAINAGTSNAFQHPQGAVFFFVLAGIQAGLGHRYWSEQPMPRAPRVRSSASVWSAAVLGRVVGRSVRGLAGLWRTSLLRRFVLREPEGAGRLLAESRSLRTLLGSSAERGGVGA